MAFNPALPLANSPISSAELRSQFNGLQAEIDDWAGFGEVDSMIASSAVALPAGVGPLGLSASNPPTQAEVHALANKLDELLAVLKLA